MKSTSPENRRPELWYPNIDFDLSLPGGGEKPPREIPIHAVAREMSLWFWALVGPESSIISSRSPSPDFLEHLEMSGLPVPSTAGDAADLSHHEPMAWGWSRDALEAFAGLGLGAHRPDPEVVREVNSRSFSQELAQSTGTGVEGARMIRDPGEVEGGLRELGLPCVLKPEFGNAGLGFIHLKRSDDVERALRTMERSARGGRWFLEPWRDRVLDLATKFTLLEGGEMRDLSHHVQSISPRGQFTSIDLPPRMPEEIKPWISGLRGAAGAIAAALSRKGYWGPVGFDSFTWRGPGGSEALVPLVEINARHCMHLFLLRLRVRLGLEGRFLRLRCAGFRELHRPSSYRHWREICGPRLFRPDGGPGRLLISPLRVQGADGQEVIPRKFGILLSAESREELEDLEP